VRNGSRAAFNWGFGYEQVLSQGVSLYGGFWVDRSTSDEDIETGLSVTSWDIYHVTAGSNFQLRALRLTLGIAYAHGSAPSTQRLDLGGIGIPGEIESSGNVTYRRLKGILGLSFEV